MRIPAQSYTLALLLIVSGCNSLNDGVRPKTPPPENHAWVAQHQSGGRQCGPGEPFVPADSKIRLAAAGVTVYDTRIEALALCEACTCPAYSAMHYALIPKAQLASARQAGFEPREPPTTP